MKETDSTRRSDWLDRRFVRFDRRLKGILGAGRIPRRQKEARADQAMEAVDDLIEGIAAGFGQIDRSD